MEWKIGDLVVLNKKDDACIYEIVKIDNLDIAIRIYQNNQNKYKYYDKSLFIKPTQTQMENFIKSELFVDNNGKTIAWKEKRNLLDFGQVKAEEIGMSLTILEKLINEVQYIEFDTWLKINAKMKLCAEKIYNWKTEPPY